MKNPVYKDILTKNVLKYTNNSRKHSEQQVQQIVKSIKEFGFTNPVLIDENNRLIAGHCRLEAAIHLNLETIPCIVLSHLTEAQKKAYVIADNKLALNADWDFVMLQNEFESLRLDDFDLELTGFSLEEIESLMPEEEPEVFCDENDCPDAPEEPIAKLGDIWLLGEHRLMCGDSTSIDAVDQLMAGNRVDLIFTDPPYNVAFNGRSGKHAVIKNDDLEENEFKDFISAVCQTILAINAPYYIWCNWKFYSILQTALPFKACIVWAKNVFGMGKGYRHQHEFCLFNGDIDDRIKNESDLWNISKDINYVHPTQKPTALAERAISNHKLANNILDLFGGSGSTLIACEKTKRRCFIMELDPKYVDVIIKRWENFTGKKAILEDNHAACTN
jgi:DNA modification methylase